MRGRPNSLAVCGRSGERMLKRPHYMALGVVVLLTIVLLKLPARAVENLKRAISGLFLPAFALTGSAEDLAVSSSYALLSRSELISSFRRSKQPTSSGRRITSRPRNGNARTTGCAIIWACNASIRGS